MTENRDSWRTRWMALPLLAGLAFCLAACQSKGQPQPKAQAETQAQERRYHLEGKVVSVDKTAKQAVVDSAAIPGFMGAMTMPYSVKDPRLLEGLAAADQIRADVVVSGDAVWLENIVVVRHGSEAPSPPTSQFHLPKPGEEVPDFALTDQYGQRVRLRQFLGKAILLTFFYTRCPLPDYCPLINSNFAAIDKALAKSPAVYAKTHLLSISFDPAHDTPKVLRSYGESYLQTAGDTTFRHWQFAVTPKSELPQITKFFAVSFSDQQDQIIHSMSTAVISPDGKLYKWYYGNDWKPVGLVTDLMNSLGDDAKPRRIHARIRRKGKLSRGA